VYCVLVSFPFTDLTSSKRRPALVVSPEAFNEAMQDLVLVALTSQLSGAEPIRAVFRGDSTPGSPNLGDGDGS